MKVLILATDGQLATQLIKRAPGGIEITDTTYKVLCLEIVGSPVYFYRATDHER